MIFRCFKLPSNTTRFSKIQVHWIESWMSERSTSNFLTLLAVYCTNVSPFGLLHCTNFTKFEINTWIWDSYLNTYKVKIEFLKGEDKTWTRGSWTPSLDRVHGPLLWTGSMDPLSWTRSMDSFFNFYKKVLHQVHGHSKTEIVPKKILTRRCWPMLTIDHKYLVVLTWRTLCLHMCSRKTVKLS